MTLNSIIKPIISEKSMNLAQSGQYTFRVSLNASKNMIKQAIQQLFNVTVVSVKTLKAKGKIKRTGKKRLISKQPDIKKAIVTLKPGESIKYFEAKDKKSKKKKAKS